MYCIEVPGQLPWIPISDEHHRRTGTTNCCNTCIVRDFFVLYDIAIGFPPSNQTECCYYKTSALQEQRNCADGAKAGHIRTLTLELFSHE
jgi:hypothetical protein